MPPQALNCQQAGCLPRPPLPEHCHWQYVRCGGLFISRMGAYAEQLLRVNIGHEAEFS